MVVGWSMVCKAKRAVSKKGERILVEHDGYKPIMVKKDTHLPHFFVVVCWLVNIGFQTAVFVLVDGNRDI